MFVEGDTFGGAPVDAMSAGEHKPHENYSYIIVKLYMYNCIYIYIYMYTINHSYGS